METDRGVRNSSHEGNIVRRTIIMISTLVTYLVRDNLIQWSIYVRRRRVMQLPIKTRVRDTFPTLINDLFIIIHKASGKEN